MNEYSVVIPVHNGAKTILATLQSVCNQSIKPKRIFVFDNNSTDETYNVVRTFSASSRIPIVLNSSTKTLYPYESFAHSIRDLNGWFLWLAADDLIVPDAAKHLIDQKCSVDCYHSIFAPVVFSDKNGILRNGQYYPENIDYKIYITNPGDSSFLYGLHYADVVKQFFPTKNVEAWDWVFLVSVIRNGMHKYTEKPLSVRDYTSFETHVTRVNQYSFFKRKIPYFFTSIEIMKKLHHVEKFKCLLPIIKLNISGMIMFSTFKRKSRRGNKSSFYFKLKQYINNGLSGERKFLVAYKLLVKVHHLFRKISFKFKNMLRYLIGRNSQNTYDFHTDSMWHVDKKVAEEIYDIPENYSAISIFIETCCDLQSISLILKYILSNQRSENLSLVKFESNRSFFEFSSVLNQYLSSVNSLEPVLIAFGPKIDKEVAVENFADYLALSWLQKYSENIKEIKNREPISEEVHLFLPSIPQPNRDAGSLDAIYLTLILGKLSENLTIFVQNYEHQSKTFLSLLNRIASVSSGFPSNDTNAKKFVYGPYAFKDYSSYLVKKSYTYVMVDAVFRRFEQSPAKMSISDLAILEFESLALETCATALAISKQDLIHTAAKFPNLTIFHYPIIRFPFNVEFRKERNTLLFIGSLTHTPNKEAVEWIVKDLAPILGVANPIVRIVLAGLGTEKYSHREFNVNGLGSVQNLSALYSNVFATITPMTIAAGINGKIVESISLGVPAVISYAASLNLPESFMKKCKICENIEDYLVAITELHSQSELIDSNSVREVMQQFDGSANLDVISKVLSTNVT